VQIDLPMTKRAKQEAYIHRLDVVSQLEIAVRHPGAAAMGAVMGGVVPWFGRQLAHGELMSAVHERSWGTAAIVLTVIAGCLVFSALSVRKFGALAFGDARKAVGFVLAVEGVLLVSQGVTSWVALALLIAINGVANGCVIAVAREATEQRREADTRRSATRAKNRSERRTGASPSPSIVRVPRVVVESSDAEIVGQFYS